MFSKLTAVVYVEAEKWIESYKMKKMTHFDKNTVSVIVLFRFTEAFQWPLGGYNCS